MAIPFAYFSIFTEKRRLAKALLAFSILVFCGAIVVGQDLSRGGVLGVGAVFLYCLARSPKKFVGSIILVVLIGVATMFTGSAFWQDMETIGDVDEGTADMRIEIWKIGMRMWRANPVLGVGAGNFRWQVGEYESTEQREKYGRDLGGSIIAHSLFVELLAELGTIGAIVVAGLLWHTWRDLRKVQRGAIGEAGRQRADGDLVTLRCYADAVTASILACLVTGVFLSLLYFSYLWLLTALAGAVAHVFRSQIKAQETAA
jgi:O-antigen ligase